MISIITAVHNQLGFNKLFLNSLRKNSSLPHEIIIVDNHSTDGSAEFFEQEGCTVIRNPENHCYPESQNMGIQLAKYDYFAFLNNDIYVAPEWDKRILEAMRIHGLEVASLGSWESVEDPYLRRRFHQRWKWLRRGKRYLKGEPDSLQSMMNKLYETDFESWCKKQYQLYYPRVYTGLCGSAVVTTQSVWEKLGGSWDEQIESADWDLHLKVTKRAVETGDIRPPHIVPWALHHHFSRVTFRSEPEKRACKHQHISIKDKWSEEELALYGPKLLEEQGFYVKLRKLIKKFQIRKTINREKVEINT